MLKETKTLLSEPYDYLAEIYDQVMEHVNYKQWAGYIKTIITSEQNQTRCVVDLSCGTGSMLKHLNLKNTKLIGCDLSTSMVKRAANKGGQNGRAFLCADFLTIPFKDASMNVAVALYDSVNYLLTDTQVLQFFNEVNRILKPGGLLIFDAVTPHICKTAFKDYQETQYFNEDEGYERRSWYDAGEQTQYNEFTIQLGDEIVEELHQQKIRRVKEWERLLKKSPLKTESVYANFTFRPVQRKSERAHFVCRAG